MAWNLEALVVGGGPVGLFSALSLVERGVAVRVIDSGAWRFAALRLRIIGSRSAAAIEDTAVR